MHRSAIIGNENVASFHGTGKFAQAGTPHQIKTNMAGQLVDPIRDLTVLGTTEKDDFTPVLLLQLNH
jgi:hypothetical protein